MTYLYKSLNSSSHHLNKAYTYSTATLESANVVLAFTVSLAFSTFFSSDSVAMFLVKAVFNGLGLVMVTGLLSLVIGNLITLRKRGLQPSISFVRNTHMVWSVIWVICLVTLATLWVIKTM